MRLNNYHGNQADQSCSEHGGEAQWSGRFDLNPNCGYNHLFNGAIDAKVSSLGMLEGDTCGFDVEFCLVAWVVNGPTWGGEANIPAFSFEGVDQSSILTMDVLKGR